MIFYLLFGFRGLMMGWFLLGNPPVLNPLQFITQPSMFTYWVTMLLAPWLVMEPAFPDLKSSFVRFFISSTLRCLLVALVVSRTKGGVLFWFVLFAAGYTALNYFYVKYFRLLSTTSKASDGYSVRP